MKKLIYSIICCALVSCTTAQKQFAVNTTADIVKLGAIAVISKHPETIATFNLVANRLKDLSQNETVDANSLQSDISSLVNKSDKKNALKFLLS